MGLDNGIVLKAKEDIEVPTFLEVRQANYPYEPIAAIPAGKSEEICYWRKCWGIRNEIMWDIGLDEDVYCCELTSDDVENIIIILEKYIRKDYYDEHHRSIWEWKRIVPSLMRQAEILSWANELLEEDKIELEFYDSY